MTTATERTPIHEQVRSFIGSSRKMLIDGKWVDAASGKTFPTYNPATGDVLSYVAEGDVRTLTARSSQRGRRLSAGHGADSPPQSAVG